MKHACLIAVLAVWLHLSANAQGLPSVLNSGCSTAQVLTLDPDQPKGDGEAITAHGELKILIIMAQFNDDEFQRTDPNWPKVFNGDTNAPPVWVRDPTLLLVPPHTTFTPVAFSLSDFYYEMSQHSHTKDPLRMYGDVVHYVFPKSRAQLIQDQETRKETMVFPWLC